MANIDLSNIRHVKLEESTFRVDPSLARQLMENNIANRSFRMGHAKDIARQMELGRWRGSPEPLIITTKGRVVNGQHRLWALIETGTTQEFIITVIPDEKYQEIFSILDQGAARSNSDVLREDNKVLQPISFLLRVSGVNKVSPQDLQPYLESDLGRIVRKINDRKPTGKIWKHNLFRAAMAVSIADGIIDENEAFETYDALLTNAISNWPAMFSTLYIQLTDTSMALNYSGRSVNNDWFIRPMYAFKHRNNDSVKMIRIYKSFSTEVEASIMRVLMKINPQFLD